MKSINGLGIALAAALSLGASDSAEAQRQVNVAHDDAQWTMPGKDYASTRFSGWRRSPPATRPAAGRWSFSTGVWRVTRDSRWWSGAPCTW